MTIVSYLKPYKFLRKKQKQNQKKKPKKKQAKTDFNIK